MEFERPEVRIIRREEMDLEMQAKWDHMAAVARAEIQRQEDDETWIELLSEEIGSEHQNQWASTYDQEIVGNNENYFLLRGNLPLNESGSTLRSVDRWFGPDPEPELVIIPRAGIFGQINRH